MDRKLEEHEREEEAKWSRPLRVSCRWLTALELLDLGFKYENCLTDLGQIRIVAAQVLGAIP